MDTNRRESDLLICVYSRPFVVVLLRVGCGYAEPYSLMAFGPYLNSGRRRMISFHSRFISVFARERAGLLCGGKTGL